MPPTIGVPAAMQRHGAPARSTDGRHEEDSFLQLLLLLAATKVDIAQIRADTLARQLHAELERNSDVASDLKPRKVASGCKITCDGIALR